MKNAFLCAIFITFFLSSAVVALADRVPEDEVVSLKERVERLERMVEQTERDREHGHRLHPVHSLYGLKISGGITFIAQAVANLEDNKRGEAAISGDLAIEGPVGGAGRAVVVLDFQKGAGLGGVTFAVGPNGNPTGASADLESFDDTNVHLTQLYYEHALMEGSLIISSGQLDITGYFDTNGLANDERSQFLANTFVNNPAVEFGGDDNFYAPGLRATYAPLSAISLTLGVFEGDGDYNNAFDSPFVMAEADLTARPLGREGNYGVYYWNRQGRPSSSLSSLADPADTGLLEAMNQGVGMSIDQSITDSTGVWLRWGLQREKVARFKGFAGGGVSASAGLVNRPGDSMGFSYGVSFIGKDFKEQKGSSTPGFAPGDEHYLEAYYNLGINGAAGTGFHISPDIQYVINPGGDRNSGDAFIYGVRLQAYF